MVFVTPEGAKAMKSPFKGLDPSVCFVPVHLPIGRDGYPVATNGKGGKSRAHRLSYRLFCGPTPHPLFVLHICGNAGCINPHHLYLGDAAQNAKDREAHGKTARGQGLPQTKLTEGDIQAIRKSADRVTDLALQYKISKSHVSNIRAGRVRTHTGKCGIETGSKP
jgi:hypothetical protein